MFGLVDCNNFFVSCERLFRPDLCHKPVMILSSNDGCVIARSNEAKALGIPMGIPVFKIKDLIQNHSIITLSSNFPLYGDLSRRIMTSLRSLCPKVEMYSIDEAFIQHEGTAKELETFGQALIQAIQQWIGIPISVGFAPTKTLAKLATRLAKKNKGVYVLMDQNDSRSVLSTTPLSDLWGVGRHLSQHFKERGLYTALDLTNADPRWIRQRFGVVGERLVRELQGLSCLPLDCVHHDKKSLQVSASFGHPVTTLEGIEQAIATYASRMAANLRRSHLKATSVFLYIQTSPFSQDPFNQGPFIQGPFTQDSLNKNQFISKELTIPLSYPTNDSLELVRIAGEGARRIFKSGYVYQKAGVIAMGLVPEDMSAPTNPPQRTSQHPSQQQLLFNQNDQRDQKDLLRRQEKQKNLSLALDSLHHRFGRKSAVIASCGLNPAWSVKARNCTPAYTTNWEDLPIVR